MKASRRERFLKLIGDGMGIDDALREVGADIYELASWLDDEEFAGRLDEWRRGMALVVEDALIRVAKKGKTVAAVKYLQSVEPRRWSERLMVEGDIEERRVVKLVFNWEPRDSIVGGSARVLPGDVIEGEVILDGKEAEGGG